MRPSPKTLFLAFTSTLALASPAFAETAVDAPLEQEAHSSAGTGDTYAPEEIIVTARRRDETAQEIPIAVSVVGGDQIDNTGLIVGQPGDPRTYGLTLAITF